MDIVEGSIKSFLPNNRVIAKIKTLRLKTNLVMQRFSMIIGTIFEIFLIALSTPVNSARKFSLKKVKVLIKALKNEQSRQIITNFKRYLAKCDDNQQPVQGKIVVYQQPVPRTIVDSLPVKEKYLQDKKEQFEEFIRTGSMLSFPGEDPVLSIILVLFNQVGLSYACLQSILKNTRARYELIIVDNNSTDETNFLLDRIEGAIIIRNNENLHFLKANNQAIEYVRGKYLLFLNNDTIVNKDWLPPLLETIEKEDVGAVGAKLVFPDGTLQEAGGIIWSDGSGWNYGRGDDADKPEYNYVREVDYCSGACLLVKKELFEQTGGFDNRFKPAYYEDTDLCFSLREIGYKVIFQPKSVVMHYEGATSGTDTFTGVKKYQEINKLKFVEKWGSILQKAYYNHSSDNILWARDRLPGERVLVIDHYVPTYDKDSGSLRMFNMLGILVELGHKVTFIGDDLMRTEPYTQELQQKGIEVVYVPHILSVGNYIKMFGKYFSVVILSRPHIAIKYIDTVKISNPTARIIYDTVDLVFLRESRRAKIENSKKTFEEAEEIKRTELYVAQKSDITFVVSHEEKAVLLKENDSLNIEIVSNIHRITKPQTPFSGRKDILFIGGFDHTPNTDAVVFFVNEIFPLIKLRLPDLRVYIVGNNPTKQVVGLRSGDVIVTGYVSDLIPYFEKCKVFVAPLRYGAGVKGKINQSMSYGLPVVTTLIGAEGIGLVDGVDALIADDPEDFAKKVAMVHENEELWNKLSINSMENIRTNFSPEIAKEKLRTIFEILPNHLTLKSKNVIIYDMETIIEK
jgi:O-antigen biosynthesis protein